MRDKPLYPAEDGRVLNGKLASKPEWGCCGFFHVQRNVVTLRIMSSDGQDWAESGLPGLPWEHEHDRGRQHQNLLSRPRTISAASGRIRACRTLRDWTSRRWGR